MKQKVIDAALDKLHEIRAEILAPENSVWAALQNKLTFEPLRFERLEDSIRRNEYEAA